MNRPRDPNAPWITIGAFCEMQGCCYNTYRKRKAMGVYRNIRIIEEEGLAPVISRADAERWLGLGRKAS